ncbi:hypothetical protein [Actinomadura violacea]|uniref:Uncharacterized protein n=1 Tax=Actinomadura violacea TaxID=2819934 RepID=A0ABS3S664_9ACTN|nr:hypothetical protein [Actinomadura violacea]MBO2464502.1 hypothetical protein [Actinomadura violacea]
MHPIAAVDATAQIAGDEWYRISTQDIVPEPPNRAMRSFGTFDLFEGDVFVDTGTTTRDVDITVEEWASEAPLRIAGDRRFAEVVEMSVTLLTRRLRILAADGTQLLARDLDGGAGSYRMRLYARYLDVRRQRHLLRLWPAPAKPMWIYQLDRDGQPIERPDRATSEILEVAMTPDQASIVRTEVEQMAIMEIQNGDIDDIVEDCDRIRDSITVHAGAGGVEQVALTPRQWKVAIAVLEHHSGLAPTPSDAEALRHVRDLIVSAIGHRLPAGRVYGQ